VSKEWRSIVEDFLSKERDYVQLSSYSFNTHQPTADALAQKFWDN